MPTFFNSCLSNFIFIAYKGDTMKETTLRKYVRNILKEYYRKQINEIAASAAIAATSAIANSPIIKKYAEKKAAKALEDTYKELTDHEDLAYLEEKIKKDLIGGDYNE